MTPRLTVAAAALVAAVGVAACGGGGVDDASGPTVVGEADPEVTRPAPPDVEVRQRRLAGLRSLVLTPEDGPGPWPLVVFVHGAGAPPELYEDLLAGIADAGHVVVAPAMPGSVGRSDARALLALPFQPLRVRQVLDAVLADPDAIGPVDPGQVAVAGHSLGAMTVLATAFHACCVDSRVDAVVSIAGRLAAFPGGGYGPGRVPVLLIHGDEDDVVPYGGSAEAMGLVGTSAHLLTVAGGDHGSYLSTGDDAHPAVVTAIDAFLTSTVGGRPRGGVADLTVAGTDPDVRLEARY